MYEEKRDIALNECTQALRSINAESVVKYITMIENAEKVFFVGVGRVLLSLKAICKRYSHLGINTVIVGDITEPAMTSKDILVVGSGSGNTLFPLEIAKKAKQIGATVIHIGSNPEGKVKEYTDFFLRIPVASKLKNPDEVQSQQPMTSLFEQSLLLFGDITASMILEDKQIVLDDLWQFHANLE
jgi:6-phospho-3-hexuloisomerase